MMTERMKKEELQGANHFYFSLIPIKGNLTGYIDQSKGVVEVTHSFETPEGDDDDDMEASTRNYRDYLKYIRDNGTV